MCTKTIFFLDKGLGTLHEDKQLDAKKIISKTDVISAMDVIEGAAIKEKSFTVQYFGIKEFLGTEDGKKILESAGMRASCIVELSNGHVKSGKMVRYVSDKNAL